MILNIRLRDGRDDELKAWLLAMPKGDRSFVVRRVLKAYLNGPTTHSQRMEVEIEPAVFVVRKRVEPAAEEIEARLARLADSF